MKLQFGRGNAKLDALEKKFKKKVFTFSLLSGHTCPYAKECYSHAVKDNNGKLHIEDGPHTKFRCFSASQEALFPAVYAAREANGAVVKLAATDTEAAARELFNNIPKNAGIIRIHVGGDFQTKAYMQAWILVATLRPDVLFYAYTKSLPFWVALQDTMPDNFILTASYGGYKDSLIAEHNLRYSKVVFSEYEARKLHLPIDHDDSHAADPKRKDKSFALLLHGTQPKGSKAAEALRKLDGKGTYGRGSKKKEKV